MSLERIENVILSNLIFNEEYTRKVIPFLKKEYFNQRTESIIFDEINNYFTHFNKLPTNQIIKIEVANRTDITSDDLTSIVEYIDTNPNLETNNTWLISETEKFCKDKALYLGIMRSIRIIEGSDKEFKEDGIPNLLSEALSISFDTNVGHDYIKDADARYAHYHDEEERLTFDIELLNKITGGGLKNKTLLCWLGGTGAGKSLVMCHNASSFLLQGKDVLYITMEMSEESIAERIDANLLDINIDEMTTIEKKLFDTRINRLKEKTQGRLFIKEYPTSGAHVGHFKSLLAELKSKQNFVPRVIIVDYLNICSSQRMKNGENSYTRIKSIAEELRGMAVEYNVPIITATQPNREGQTSSDLELTNVSESIGLPQTLDLFLGLSTSDELEEMGQVLIKQLKNRYNDLNFNKRFTVGINKRKMRLFDVEESAQSNISGASKHNDADDSFYNESFGSNKKKVIDGAGFNF